MVQEQTVRVRDTGARGRYGVWAFALTLALLAGVWLRPYLLSFYHLEIGSRALERALVAVFTDRLAPEQVVDAKQLEVGAAHLKGAIRWDPRNAQARRELARVYLSLGQPEMALEVLQPALSVQPENPLLSLEMGDVYDSLGQTEDAIKAYQAGHIGSRQAPLTANYLKLAEAHAEQGGGDVAIDLWRQALKADPGNLYALYRLAKIHREMGDKKSARTYEDQLQHFGLQSVAVPLDLRLAEYQAQVMAGLVEDGVWKRATLLNVVSYQGWKFSQGVSGLMTERILLKLLEQWPGDADILYYQADLYQRRGELERAETTFRQVLAAKPDYAQAYLRLGMLAEAKGPSGLEQAVECYGQYHQKTVPTDVLDLRKLTEACSALETSGTTSVNCPMGTLRQELAEKTDVRQVAAKTLGVEPDKIMLGENLIAQGDFEDLSAQALNWTWDRPNSGPASFVGGLDRYGTEGVIRQTNLWRVGELYANYASKGISLEPDTFYVSSFDYRTSQLTEGTAAVLLVFPGNSAQALLDTAGTWQRAIYVRKSTTSPVTATLSLGNWGVGEVLFDRVELRQVSLRP